MKTRSLLTLVLAAAAPLLAAVSASATPALAAPPNDAFSAATALSQGTVSGSTAGATTQAGEPDHWGEARSVWYRWTAPGTGGTKVAACGSGHLVDVYTGSTVDGLTLVTPGGCERTWQAKAGTTYRIAVSNSSSTRTATGASAGSRSPSARTP